MGIRRSQTRGRADPGNHPEAAKTLSIVDACEHTELFAAWFTDRASWSAWFVFLRVMFGLPLDAAGLELFKACTGRGSPAPGGYTEVSLIIGRRGGKSLVLALIAVYLACFYDWKPYLTGGERGTIMVIATDRKTATVILKYIKAFLAIAPLAAMIERETAVEIDLNNGVTIEIQTASFRTIRGRTCVAALCDEVAFWNDEGANPDVEIVAALKPAMATIGGRAMLLKASSPYARRGALWNDYKKHFGKDESATLVWRCDSKGMNPSLPQSVIDDAYLDDPLNAAAEYGAEFRSDVAAFVDRQAVEACVIDGRFELPPVSGISYGAFCDPSGGGGSDAMTLAIAHKEDNLAILDVIREVRPPFSPESAVADFCTLLKSYHVNTVFGDRFAGLWPRERFAVHGIEYNAAVKPKSDLYRDLLPIINGGRAELLDHPKMIAQLCALERKTARSGRDSIDHPPGANSHDDVVNACAGCLTTLITVEAPQVCFGTYSTSFCSNHLGYNGNVDNRSAGEIFASMPPEHWAAMGVFHPNDRAYWESRGVIKPQGESQ